MNEWSEERFRREVVEDGAPALVEFWAEWCAYSRLLPPKLAQLEERYGERLSTGRIDVERYPALVRSLGLRYIPALVLFDAGVRVRTIYGDRHLGELVAYVERSHILA